MKDWYDNKRGLLMRIGARLGIAALLITLTPFVFPGDANATTSTTTQTTAGSYNFTVPAGVTKIRVNLWGGGGAGGGVSATTGGGGGGAGGQFATKLVTVTPGSSIPYVVAATKAGTSASNGSAGNDSTFNSTTVVAKGGAGGLSENNGGTGGVGATTNGVGDTVNAGGSGGGTYAGSTYSGAGGGAAGTTGAGGAASGKTAGTGKTLSGGNGAAGLTAAGTGGTGTQAGGGGSGSLETSSGSNAGGTGAAGRAEIAYTIPTASTTAPNPGATVSGSAVTISATSSSEDGVALVSFYIDNTLVATSSTGSPYTMTWNTTSYTTGPHSIFVVSQNNTGNYATSTTINVTVNNLAVTGYTNSTETGLNYAASCTTCGARIGPAASGQSQSITITGNGFNAATGTIKIGTHTIPSANITSWGMSSITFKTDTANDSDASWRTVYGGASALTVSPSSGVATSTGVNFYVFPQILSTTQPSGLPADSAREYNAADSDGIITLNGTRFGSAQGSGSVTILGSTATINSWSSTAIQAQVPTAIANNNYTGSLVVTQGTGGNSKTNTYANTFRIMPRITGYTPASVTNSSAITFNGDHLCENAGTCPTSFDGSDIVTFTSSVLATTFTSWTNTVMATQVPSSAQSGAATLTSNGYTSNTVNVTLLSPSPNAPTNPQQYYDSGLTRTIPTGSGASTTPIYITMTMDPGASSGTLYPEVEYEPIGTAFTCSGTTACGAAVEGNSVTSATTVDCSNPANNCAISISPAENNYHWQMRVRKNVNGTDYYSGWVSYPVTAAKVVYLTTTGSGTWTVPSDWNSASNTIEVIGGGGGGHMNFNDGGGGGAYSAISNLALMHGSTVSYSVGAGGTNIGGDGGDTWFNASSFALASVAAKGGTGGAQSASAPGGAASAGRGTILYSGGNGAGSGCLSGGGGGAGGPQGNGGNAGGDGGNCGSGTGGGGGGGGSNGANMGAVNQGTFGGNNYMSSGGGAGGTSGSPAGVNGSAGGGGGGGYAGSGGVGASGGNGTEWDATHGSGGGGGGAGWDGTGLAGGNGGLYGGGGGGDSGSVSAPGGTGGQGIIVVTYTPIAAGNTESDTDFSIDKTPPVISNVSSGSPGTNSATITWNTSENATTQLQYNTTGNFVTACSTNNDCTTINTTMVTSHSILLSNLNSATTYYFRVRSMDAAGNESISPTQTFTTSNVTQPAKTMRFHIDGLQGMVNGGAATSSMFTVPLPESSYAIKSAFVEIHAVYSTTGTTPNGIVVQVGSDASHTHAIPSGSASVGHISFFQPVVSLPISPATTTLSITPQANTSLYILSSDIIVTYGYTP